MATIHSGGVKGFALIMLITGAVDTIRNLPATAWFGTSLIFFFIFAGIVFLVPAALVSAELASSSSEESGIFHWTCRAFGEKTGFFAVWLQWISNLVWFPTILSFIAGMATYFFSPALAQSKIYLVSVILGTFWILTLINLKGVKVSAKFASFCATVGLIIPMSLIILFALIWVLQGHLLQIHFTLGHLIPKFSDTQNWISLTAIMTAFLGIELSTVHVKDVENPQKSYPKALMISVLIILITMILGSLSIAIVLPKDQINLVSGILQAFSTYFTAYHLSWVMPILTIFIIIGTAGSIISWIISPARGLLQAAQHNFLPDFFKKENKYGVASNLLIIQAVLVSVFCLAFLLMPSVNGSYWLLTALSTQLYILMYIIMFVTGLVMRHKFPHLKRNFKIPGGKTGLWIVSLLGFLGCGLTEIVGFIPPHGINVGSFLRYEMIFIIGMISMMLPAVGCFVYKYNRF
ncbi:MAG TPA: APC family permease [Gammaproteobacteria bacterium]|nr:APC family permease [Gammaproteobacteria bacterium]